MPEAVADYLLDAVLDGTRAGDRSLAAMVGTAENARRLRRAATKVLGGRQPCRHARARRPASCDDRR